MPKHLAGWLVIIILLVFGIGTGSAQSNIRVLVINEFLNVRVAPAIGASVVTTVQAGTVFDNITGRSGNGEWLRVDYLCQESWINLAPALLLEGDISGLPSADPRSIPFGGFEAPRAGFSNATGTMLGRATDGLRIRSGPSTAYPTLANINFNQQFYITGRNSCASWLQVQFEGTLGWVSATFVAQVGEGNVLTMSEGGIIADSAAPQVDGDNEFFSTLRLMLGRLDLAQVSLDQIRSSWTDSALTGRAVCQDYPVRPSDFNTSSPLLAANFGTLEPLRIDFNLAMQNVRDAIDLFIQVCNQPGTGNPVGQTTVSGALNMLNNADQLFLSLRQRLLALLPPLELGLEECLLIFNRSAEVLPLVTFGTVYADSLTRHTYARGYCFNGIEGQIINFQVLPIPQAELETFVAISALDNPTDFIVINQGRPGDRQTVGPIILPSTGAYLIIIADLQEDSSTRISFGDFAFLMSDLTFSTSFRTIRYDEATDAIVLEDAPDISFAVAAQEPAAACPSVSFTCAQLFSCAEASACLAQGNFTLDVNGDGIACNEAPANLVSGTIACN